MPQSLDCFITGTDTEIGKTYVSALLLRGLRELGVSALGMKPIASGAERGPQGWRNEDALALLAAAPSPFAYELHNPYCFEPPIAPHRAAELVGVEPDLERIASAHAELARHGPVLVEGAGGWCVPLSAAAMMADIPRRLGLPVVLVVGLRLGCINHALLSARAIQADGLRLLGWIGNRIDPAMLEPEASIRALDTRMPVPCLGLVDHRGGDARTLAQAYLDGFG